MKTYLVNSDYGPKTVRIPRYAHYIGLPHNPKPLAIEVEALDGDGCWEPYGVLTVNMDPWTDRQDQTGTRAFVKTYGENEGWAQELLDALAKDGAAKRLDTVLVNNYGTMFPLYEFNLEILFGK